MISAVRIRGSKPIVWKLLIRRASIPRGLQRVDESTSYKHVEDRQVQHAKERELPHGGGRLKIPQNTSRKRAYLATARTLCRPGGSGPLYSARWVLAPGTRVGRYEILARVGGGGMGEVYRARDVRLSRTVAIKVLGERVNTDAAYRSRFEREARAIAVLNHPHICTLYDLGHHQGIDFLVASRGVRRRNIFAVHPTHRFRPLADAYTFTGRSIIDALA